MVKLPFSQLGSLDIQRNTLRIGVCFFPPPLQNIQTDVSLEALKAKLTPILT